MFAGVVSVVVVSVVVVVALIFWARGYIFSCFFDAPRQYFGIIMFYYDFLRIPIDSHGFL